jgi:hypothetical protein
MTEYKHCYTITVERGETQEERLKMMVYAVTQKVNILDVYDKDIFWIISARTGEVIEHMCAYDIVMKYGSLDQRNNFIEYLKKND